MESSYQKKLESDSRTIMRVDKCGFVLFSSTNFFSSFHFSNPAPASVAPPCSKMTRQRQCQVHGNPQETRQRMLGECVCDYEEQRLLSWEFIART